MTQLTLSKSNYLKESAKLVSYNRYLPSLDLKRKQLLAVHVKEKEALLVLEASLETLLDKAKSSLPMLSTYHFSLDSLIVLEGVVKGDDNLMGVHLPSLKSVDISIKDYGFLTKPLWLDFLCEYMREAIELSVRTDIHKQRVELLSAAVRRATQRVNLVSEVLIPEAKSNIRKIKIFLDDNERASVVRSKLAKKKKLSLVAIDAFDDGDFNEY